MEIVSAEYGPFGGIHVRVEGQKSDTVITVPNDMSNKDRQELAEWEAKGNVITTHQVVAPADRSNYDAMLDRRMNAALAKGDTDAAFDILLQLQE